MTVLIVALLSLAVGVWWGQRWADWSARVDKFLEEQQQW